MSWNEMRRDVLALLGTMTVVMAVSGLPWLFVVRNWIWCADSRFRGMAPKSPRDAGGARCLRIVPGNASSKPDG